MVDGLVGDETWTSMGFEFESDNYIALTKKNKPNFVSKKDQGTKGDVHFLSTFMYNPTRYTRYPF